MVTAASCLLCSSDRGCCPMVGVTKLLSNHGSFKTVQFLFYSVFKLKLFSFFLKKDSVFFFPLLKPQCPLILLKRYLWFNLETLYLNGSSWPISSNLILSNPLYTGSPQLSLSQKLFTCTYIAFSMTILTAHILE